MRYFITGYKGQLGYDIKRELLKRNIKESNILAVGREELDITNKEQVEKIILKFKPDVIFHCAAWTAVDKAENNVEETKKVNVLGTKYITDASININAKLIYISTDYVFDGNKDGIYVPNDKTNPQNVYGLTKYLGEKEAIRNPKHYITRVSWVFGINGNNFVKTMLKLATNHNSLNIVSDQIGSPTYTVDLSKVLVDMAHSDKFGTYHITNEGFCSWAEFAQYIFDINNIDLEVNKVTTQEYLELLKAVQAYRPKNSRLSKEKLLENGFEKLPSWQDATNRYCEELKEQKKQILKL